MYHRKRKRERLENAGLRLIPDATESAYIPDIVISRPRIAYCSLFLSSENR
jgi:hypothetical protein